MAEQESSTSITSDDKLWAALGYPIPLIALIMLLIEEKKKRKFIKYHAVQALSLLVVLIVVEIVISILNVILSNLHIGFIGLVFSCLTPFMWLLLLWPAYLAYQGKYFEVPVVTKFLKSQKWIS